MENMNEQVNVKRKGNFSKKHYEQIADVLGKLYIHTHKQEEGDFEIKMRDVVWAFTNLFQAESENFDIAKFMIAVNRKADSVGVPNNYTPKQKVGVSA